MKPDPNHKNSTAKNSTPHESAKIPFWPTLYQIMGVAGCFVGAALGPFLAWLVLLLCDWLGILRGGSPIMLVAAFVLLVPLGAAAGISVGTRLAEKRKR